MKTKEFGESHDPVPSEERLNAFVDGQLDHEEHARMQRLACRDPATARAVCELHLLKDMVRRAYAETAPRAGDPPPAARGRPALSAAALALCVGMLATGAIAGWLAHGWLVAQELSLLRAVATTPATQVQRILLHVSSGDPVRFRAALDDTERFLKTSRDAGRVVQVEIVANAEGLQLIRADGSPFVERLRVLAQRYPNVRILACSRTIEKLRLQGIEVRLPPEAQVVPGALERIVERLQAGWIYIKV